MFIRAIIALIFAGFVTAANASPATTKPSFIDMLIANCGITHMLIGGATSPACGPTPTRAGDLMYFNGTTWVSLPGNNTSTGTLQETNVGVPSWVALSAGAAGQLPGTATNDNATAGNVGEVIDGSAALSSVSVTNGTPANITSVPLTAGDWEVYGTCYYTPAATTTATLLQCSTNVTTATIDPAPGNFGEFTLNNSVLSAASNIMSVSPGQPKRYSLASPTTVFLTTNQAIGVSTMTAGGKIHAVRTR